MRGSRGGGGGGGDQPPRDLQKLIYADFLEIKKIIIFLFFSSSKF